MDSFDINTFRDAAPYIYAHRDQIFVISLSSLACEDEALPELVQDLALLHTLGAKLILVHGVNLPLVAQSCFTTDPESTPSIVATDLLEEIQALIGQERALLESLFSTGLINTPMSGMKLNIVSGNFVRAKPLGVLDGVDYLHHGGVRRIDQSAIQSQLQLGNIVLLSPLGHSATGECFYVNATEVASATAASLQSDKLIFMMDDTPPLDQQRKPIKHLSLSAAQTLLKRRKKLAQGTRHYIQLAIDACLNRVGRVHLLDRNLKGALLRELYSHDGAGTLITADDYDDIRPATIEDAGGILSLIQALEEQGVLVPRSREDIELCIHQFDVIQRDGLMLGCISLHLLNNSDAAEIACLAIHPDYQREGHGKRLLNHLEKKAYAQGINELYVLTTRTLHWFYEQGFKKAALDDLPVARRKVYNYQRNSKVLRKRIANK